MKKLTVILLSLSLSTIAHAGYNMVSVLTSTADARSAISEVEREQNLALTAAVVVGDIEKVAELVEQGVDVNIITSTGNSVLSTAIFVGNMDMVRFLVNEARADVNIVDASQSSPLTVSGYLGNVEAIELLLENGANMEWTNQYGYTAVGSAVKEGNMEATRYLIEQGADLNRQHYAGQTVLMEAIIEDDLKMVKYLVGKDVDLDIQNNRGYTALMLAILSKNLDIIRVLVDAGSSLTIESKDGFTPLMLAAYSGSLETVQYLVEEGGLDPKDISVLTAAKGSRNQEIIEYINQFFEENKPE